MAGSVVDYLRSCRVFADCMCTRHYGYSSPFVILFDQMRHLNKNNEKKLYLRGKQLGYNLSSKAFVQGKIKKV